FFSDFFDLGLFALGAKDTTFLGAGAAGSGLGGGVSTTFSGGAFSASFRGTKTGSGAGLISGAAAVWAAGAAAGGPGIDTKETLMAPCPNLGGGADWGINITDPMKIT
ncbi:MAG: hypothetical protein P8X90_18845, partial [Desulfobacterales bacterium]